MNFEFEISNVDCIALTNTTKACNPAINCMNIYHHLDRSGIVSSGDGTG